MSRSPPTARARAIPGRGGWGVLIRMGAREKELSGGETLTTNNRMELMAAIEGLNALTRPCRVTLSTDSRYVMDGLTKWIHGWRKNGWRTVRQEAGQECRSVAGADRRRRAAPRRMGVGEGPCRPPRQRARRQAGERRRARATLIDGQATRCPTDPQFVPRRSRCSGRRSADTACKKQAAPGVGIYQSPGRCKRRPGAGQVQERTCPPVPIIRRRS